MLTYTNPPAGCYITHTCPEWISVKERKPHNGQIIIAYGFREGGAKPEVIPSKFGICSWGEDWACLDEFGAFQGDISEVTHWMNLPSGPEKDKQ
jgi:hypothetical protein